MTMDEINARLLEEFRSGEKPSGESKEYLRKVSQATREARLAHPNIEIPTDKSKTFVGNRRLHRRGRKHPGGKFADSIAILLPCFAKSILATASPYLGNGYWYPPVRGLFRPAHR